MIRHLHKKINLSNFKSFINGKMPAYKDNVVVDILESKNQEKYNTDSNHSMLPITVIIDKWRGSSDTNDKPWHISWNTLHKLYVFLKNTEKEYIDCYKHIDNLSIMKEMATDILSNIDFLDKSNVDISNANTIDELINLLDDTTSALGISFNNFIDNFLEIQSCIVDFVEKGTCDGSCYIQYNQDIENMNPCTDDAEIYSFFEVPLMMTNSIDNLGQVTNIIEPWQQDMSYNKNNIASFDDNDWILTNPVEKHEGYEWNDKYKEKVFGNLTFDENKQEYVYIETNPQWKRAINSFNHNVEKTFDGDMLRIEGEIPSQLEIFNTKSVFYDELGNFVNGEFIVTEDIKNNYNGVLRPKINDSLSLQYKVGSVNNLTEIRLNNDEIIYWGNILHSIIFYVELSDGKILDLEYDTLLPTGLQLKHIYDSYTIKHIDDVGFTVVPLLLPINDDNKTFFDSLLLLEAKLKCKIKYNIGSFIKKENGKFIVDDSRNNGIEYTDIMSVNCKKFMYNKSISERYPIYYYELERERLDNSDDYKSYFSMVIPKPNQTESDKLFGENDIDKFDLYRGFIYSPTIREDYYIGTASQEKVSGNIYIDRGISSAFEKHLKLQEVSSIQDLENYSNGGFFTITSTD